MFSKFVDGLIGVVEDVSRLFGESSWRLSPVMVALAPVIFLAVTVAEEAIETLGLVAAWVIGSAVGTGLELFGIGASRTAVKLWGIAQEREGWWRWAAGLATVGVLFYVVAAITVIWNLENSTLPLKLVGTLLYLLSPFAYVVHALMSQAQIIEQVVQETAVRALVADEAEAERQRQTDDEQRAFENRLREQEAERLFLLRQEKLRLEAENERVAIEVRTAANVPEVPVNVLERSPEYDELLRKIREGSADSVVTVAAIQEVIGRGKTAVYALLRYGQDVGAVAKVGRGRYRIMGDHEK